MGPMGVSSVDCRVSETDGPPKKFSLRGLRGTHERFVGLWGAGDAKSSFSATCSRPRGPLFQCQCMYTLVKGVSRSCQASICKLIEGSVVLGIVKYS